MDVALDTSTLSEILRDSLLLGAVCNKIERDRMRLGGHL
jgi:hypothetical protein